MTRGKTPRDRHSLRAVLSDGVMATQAWWGLYLATARAVAPDWDSTMSMAASMSMAVLTTEADTALCTLLTFRRSCLSWTGGRIPACSQVQPRPCGR